jgi:sirohydrochlorin cobaltochelatase
MTTPPNPTRAIVLFAHGSSDPTWAQPFERIRERLQSQLPGVTVTLAYLERMSPSLEDAVASLRGVDTIQVAPLFLGVGGHMRNDFPQLVAAARARTSAAIEVLPTLGESAEMTVAISDVLVRWTTSDARKSA